MYRFLLRPRWIISHLLIVGLVVAMISLMFWQLRRLDEKKALNALIESRADRTPTAFAEILNEKNVTRPGDADEVEFRAALATGTYDTAAEFTVPNRTLNGAPGRLLVTPLVWSDTEAPLLVVRGFIPQAIDDDVAPIDGVEPPTGEVQVRGWLRQPETPEGIQSSKVDLGDNRYARLDITRLAAARDAEYQPAYLQLGAQDPPTEGGDVLTPFPLPERSEGPHFSYAVQWAIFTLIALIGYPLVLRRVARGKDLRRPDDVPSDGPPSGDVPSGGPGGDGEPVSV